MVKKSLATLALSALMVTVGFASEIGYKYLGRIKTTNPAFISVEKFPNQPEFLLISEFGALVSGKVSVIPNIGQAVLSSNFTGLQTYELYNNFKWPNSVSTVPEDVFGQGVNAIVVPDGFLPPGKGNGNIFVLTTDIEDVSKASTGVH